MNTDRTNKELRCTPYTIPRDPVPSLAAERPFSLSYLRAILTKLQVLLWQKFGCVSRSLGVQVSWQRHCWAFVLRWHPLEIHMSCLAEPQFFKIFPKDKILVENWRETTLGSLLLLFTLLSYSNTQRSIALTVNTLNLAPLKLFFTQLSLKELEKPYRDIPNLCMPIYVADSKDTLSNQVLPKIRFYLLITVLMLFFKF